MAIDPGFMVHSSFQSEAQGRIDWSSWLDTTTSSSVIIRVSVLHEPGYSPDDGSFVGMDFCTEVSWCTNTWMEFVKRDLGLCKQG